MGRWTDRTRDGVWIDPCLRSQPAGRAPGIPLFLLAEFDCRLSNRAKLGVTVKERAEKALKASKVSGPAEAPSLSNCKLRALLSSVLDDDST
jgi:hypothetical protein